MEKIMYDGRYLVTSEGNIFSLFYKNGNSFRKRESPYLLKQVNINGYRRVIIAGKKNLLVHRAVAEAFLPDFYRECQINHIDGDKANNNLSNLEISNNSHNQIHSVYQLNHRTKKKLSDEKIIELAKRFANGEVLTHLAKEAGLGLNSLHALFKRRLLNFETNFAKESIKYIAHGFAYGRKSKYREMALSVLAKLEGDK